MLKKTVDLLSGIRATLIGGIFLVISLMLSGMGKAVPMDPAWVTVLICGIPLIYLSVWRIIHNPGISKISSALLITIAMFAAIAIGDLFAAGEVAFIMAIGAILEDMTTKRARKGLRKLMSLSPAQGRLIQDGQEKMISAEQIRQGDVVRVLPGETIPVDGVVISGETSVDQSVMTGESLPVDKQVGDGVFCGTLNRFGTADIRATAVGTDSSLQKMIRMVEQADRQKAPMARIADRAASWLVPVAMAIAIVAGLITRDVVRAVTVLVVFCPCALVLATPTAVMAAIGQATRHGVIIKSGEALEKMGKVDTFALDKTGTLTCGTMQVSDVIPLQPDLDPKTLLELAAGAESRSEHPLGKAVASCARSHGLTIQEPDTFTMEAGRGICTCTGDRQLLCGNEAFLQAHGIAIPDDRRLTRLREEGKAAILVAENGSCIGVLALTDVLRPEAGDMVDALHSLHSQVVLLTGDNPRTADYFAARAGIRQVRAQLLPREKVTSITQLQQAGMRVCMIGDGVNDAPALKTADVGIAMGGMGSDIVVEAADISLMQDDLSRLPYLKRLSNATVATIRASITLSMVINFLAVTLSVLGVLTPTTGALVHNAGSCLVVLIAALLYDRKFE